MRKERAREREREMERKRKGDDGECQRWKETKQSKKT